MASLGDLQKLQGMVDRRRGAAEEPLWHFASLAREVGQVGEELTMLKARADEVAGTGVPAAEAHAQARVERRDKLGLELADCLALLFRLANCAGVSLEECYNLKLDKAMRG